MEDSEWWSYHPNFISNISVEDVIEECNDLWSGERIYKGEIQTISRLSCVFTDDIKRARRKLPNYHDMKFYTWDMSPTTLKIKKRVEKKVGHSFDYVLVHLYTDGTASIGYHNDKESLNGEVASFSIGQERKFRIRLPDQTKGFVKEYLLGNDALFIMKAGMQKRYIHGVPKELKVKEPRINWTFRSFEKKKKKRSEKKRSEKKKQKE